MGKLFERYYSEIDWNEIIAVVDKKEQDIAEFCDVPVIKPQQIHDFTFDYIAIFSNVLFEDIKNELIGDYFIKNEMITSWRSLLPLNTYLDYEIINNYRKILQEFQFYKILDIGMMFFSQYFFNKDSIINSSKFCIDGVGKNRNFIGHNLYANIFQDVDQCADNYQAAFIWDRVESLEEVANRLKNKVRYILFHISYALETRKRIEDIDKTLEGKFVYKRLAMSDMIMWIIDLKSKVIRENIGIYVVTHRSYRVQCDDMYHPICVGESYKNEKYLTETDGENISYLNEKINECTALYWIWKNTNTEYVGLNHYRRYFYNNNVRNNGNYLDKETAYKILTTYDIILAEPVLDYRRSMIDVMINSMDRELCMKALNIIRKAIGKRQPDYKEAFEHVMNGHLFYPCNMFVTHRKVLNLYCEWLFSFLIEAAEEINVEGYNDYDKRAMGFMAERLLTTWLLKQNIKIKEMPYVTISN